MTKSKKQIFTIIGVFALVMLLGTVTYAFFNYTRTGAANTINVGRISFSTNQPKTISLSDVFPISSTNVLTDTDNVGTLEIEITGDTDYSDGIEYLVTSENAHVTASDGTLIPISLDVSISNLGTSDNNYFTNRGGNTTIYKKLVGDTLDGDEMLLVGYIKPNPTAGTASGIDGSITIRAYFDQDKIGISDTYPSGDVSHMEGSSEVLDYTDGTTDEWANGRTILTTTEWNNLQTSGVSFQVRVEANEGIWVNERKNFEIAGSSFITMLNDANTTAKYEVLRDTIEDDNATSTLFLSSNNSNFSMSNGVVTINQNNKLKKLTLGATVNGNTIYKTIDIDRLNEPLVDVAYQVTAYENEFARLNDGEIIEYEGYYRTDYIEIGSNKVLLFNSWYDSSSAAIIVFYDENKNYISSINENNKVNLGVYSVDGRLVYGKILPIPSNAKYMISNMRRSVYNLHAVYYHLIDSDKISLVDMTLDYTPTSTLDNVSIVNFGDSIFGNRSAPNDISSYINTYFGSTTYNVAFSGTRMARHSSTNYDAFSMYRLADAILANDFTLQDNNVVDSSFTNHLSTLESIDFDNIDYVTLAFGTNDSNGGTPYPTSDPLDTNRYVGAARYSINKLKEANPNIKIVLLTPIYRFWSEYSDASNKAQSSYYFTEYITALKKVAMEYDNVYLFDGYSELGLNSVNKYVYFDYRDGTHPNVNGIKLYAYKLGKFIENLENE